MNLLRRSALPLATAAAAISLAGCAMGSGAQEAGAGSAAPLAAEPTAQQRTADRVREFTTNIDAALDQVDRERLRAADRAAQEKKLLAAPESPASQAAVVLASASDASGPGAATSGAGAAARSGAATPPQVAQPSSPPAAAPIAPPATALISPIAAPPKTTPSAMGAMVAMTTPLAEVSPPAAPTAAALPVAAAPLEPTVDEALAVLRKKVAVKPTLNTALAMALLDSANPAPADLGKGLPESDQKIFTDLLAALQGMTASTTGVVSERAAPLLDAAKKWQAAGELNLPVLALASRVDSFGVYTAIDAKFEQGKKHTVIIYCEVANFQSKKGEDGNYQTRLSQQETLITEDGLMVWRPNAEEVEDRSRNQRRDFYLVKKLTIPENLAVGNYTLRMTVNDLNGNKTSMVSLPIEIVNK